MRFLFWSLILIFSLVVLGLVMRILALQNIPLSESLMIRGASCFFLVFIYARKEKLSLWPKSIKTQYIRAFLAGLALTLFALSYNWLTASTVAVLSNIDVPLLILLGSLVGMKTSLRVKILSFACIGFLVWYVLGLEQQPDLWYGLSSLMTACFLLCFGYYFIKKSMEEENYAITILTPALAIIFYGMFQEIIISTPAFNWAPTLFFMDILSGAAMFFAYISTMQLYRITDLATAEFPTLLASILIQPFEAFFLDMPIQTTYLLPTIAFVIMTYFLLMEKNKCTPS